MESEVATGLSVILVTDKPSRPPLADVVRALPCASILTDFLLERIYGAGSTLGHWATETESAPDTYSPRSYFLDHMRQDVPPILETNIRRIERELKCPAFQQWAFEWERVCNRSEAPYSDYPYHFGDYLLAQNGAHPHVVTRQSEVYRSAYERTIAHAVVEWGLTMESAALYLVDIIPVSPGLFELEAQPEPDGLAKPATDLCQENADLEAAGRALLKTLDTGGAFRPASLNMPTPCEISEFGNIELRAYLTTPDFVPKQGEIWHSPQELVWPDRYTVAGDLPKIEQNKVARLGITGIAWPVTFGAIPLMHGTWHDEYLSVGFAVPCSYVLSKDAKFDADKEGVFVATLDAMLARTIIWHDHWTPLHAPQGSTRCGVLCMLDRTQLLQAAERFGARLTWRVDVVTWTRKSVASDLSRTHRSAFFLDQP
jgi:hypothetical protein